MDDPNEHIFAVALSVGLGLILLAAWSCGNQTSCEQAMRPYYEAGCENAIVYEEALAQCEMIGRDALDSSPVCAKAVEDVRYCYSQIKTRSDCDMCEPSVDYAARACSGAGGGQ